MRNLLTFVILVIFMMAIGSYCESRQKPDDIGMHLDYSIICENGIKYKVLSDRGGVIMLLHSNGSPVKCNETRK